MMGRFASRVGARSFVELFHVEQSLAPDKDRKRGTHAHPPARQNRRLFHVEQNAPGSAAKAARSRWERSPTEPEDASATGSGRQALAPTYDRPNYHH